MTKLLGFAMLVVIAYSFPGLAVGQVQGQPAPALTPTPDAWTNVYGPPVTTRPVYAIPMYYRGTVQVVAPVPRSPVIGYRYHRGVFPWLFGRRMVARPVLRW